MWLQGSSLDHLRNAKEGLRGIGRLSENWPGDVARPWGIFTKIRMPIFRAAGCGNGSEENLCHGLDAGYVEFLQFVHIGEDFVELAAVSFRLFGGQFQLGQLSDSSDVFGTDFHGDSGDIQNRS